MIQALNQYDQNHKQVKKYGALYNLVVAQVPILATEAESILRAQWVMAVSSLDTYIHDVLRIGLLQIYAGTRPSNNSSDAFNITIKSFMQIEASPITVDKTNLLEAELRRISEKDSYQSPKGIEYALSLIGINNVWSRISPVIGMPASDIKSQLSLIVRRRNKIAHESDYDHLTASLITISKADADDVVEFIDKLVRAINTLL